MLLNIARGAWGAQIIFGVVVLAMSVVLVKEQFYGKAPATLGYAAFCGGFAIVAAIVGLASTFVEAIPDIVILGIDGLAALLALAGGIAVAIGIKGVDCSGIKIDSEHQENFRKAYENGLLNEGEINSKNEFANGISQRLCGKKDNDDDFAKCITDKLAGALTDRCKRVVADQALLFITFGIAAATMALVFFFWKKGKRSGGRTYV